MLATTLASLDRIKAALSQTTLCDADIINASTLGVTVHIHTHAIRKAISGVDKIVYWVDESEAKHAYLRWRVSGVEFVTVARAADVDGLRAAFPAVSFVDETSSLLAGV